MRPRVVVVMLWKIRRGSCGSAAPAQLASGRTETSEPEQIPCSLPGDFTCAADCDHCYLPAVPVPGVACVVPLDEQTVALVEVAQHFFESVCCQYARKQLIGPGWRHYLNLMCCVRFISRYCESMKTELLR